MWLRITFQAHPMPPHLGAGAGQAIEVSIGLTIYIAIKPVFRMLISLRLFFLGPPPVSFLSAVLSNCTTKSDNQSGTSSWAQQGVKVSCTNSTLLKPLHYRKVAPHFLQNIWIKWWRRWIAAGNGRIIILSRTTAYALRHCFKAISFNFNMVV